MRSPGFLTPAYISRSIQSADNRLINLYMEVVEVKGAGKEPAALYMTPGLNLLVTCGSGPIRGKGLATMGGLLYVVSGAEVYSVDTNFTATLLGSIGTDSGPVSIITNGSQLTIFDGDAGYLVPGGSPLVGGTVGTAGSGYIVGDVIYLLPVGGSQNATAFINVTGVTGGGGVATFTIGGGGAFPSGMPTSFTQRSTPGGGSGFVLGAPVYGPSVGVYAIPLPFSGPVSASYQEGFGLVNQSGTDIFWQSNLFDLSVYDPLNFSSADGLPDNVVSIHELHLEQWLFKTTNTEIWVNAGQPNFAFARLTGVLPEIGCCAPFSVAKVGEHLIWLSRTTQGLGQVMMNNGYQPARVSTHSVEQIFASYPTMTDAIAFTYQQEGHSFYQISFPSANDGAGETWVYDVTESQTAGTPMWHQRAAFSNGEFSRHWANAHVNFTDQSVVGDYRNGNIYAYDLDVQTDNGTQRKWLRTWRAFPQAVDEPVRFNSLIIDAESGIGVAPTPANPQVMLRWSDDGGYKWSNIRTAAAGKTGQTAARILFTRLGSTRSYTGLDRIFELSSTDQFNVCLVGARLDVDGQATQR